MRDIGGDPRRKVARVVLLAATIAGADAALALERSALEQVSGSFESKVFALKVDLHEAQTAGGSMQAPTLERKGWHHDNPTGPIHMRAGTLVEVTWVLNYSERGLFLELARAEADSAREPADERPRLRIRIMVEAAGEDPSGQAAEAMELIGLVLEGPVSP